MAFGHPGNSLRAQTELSPDLNTGHAFGQEAANLIVASAEGVELRIDVRQAEVGCLPLHNQERVEASNHLLALDHVSHSPDPDVATVDELLIPTAAFTPDAADTDAGVDGIDHSPVGVGDAYTAVAGAVRLSLGNPDGAFSVHNAGKPTKPLAVSHWRDRMHGGERWANAFHVADCTTPSNTHDNLNRYIDWACGMAAVMSRALATADPDSRTVVDLYCGGGLGAVGWHDRFWSYAESGVAA